MPLSWLIFCMAIVKLHRLLQWLVLHVSTVKQQLCLQWLLESHNLRDCIQNRDASKCAEMNWLASAPKTEEICNDFFKSCLATANNVFFSRINDDNFMVKHKKREASMKNEGKNLISIMASPRSSVVVRFGWNQINRNQKFKQPTRNLCNLNWI